MDVVNDAHHQDGADAETATPWQLYREQRLIQSAGRTLLSGAFSEYMALTAGISPLEIASAFDASGSLDDRDMIKREIHFLAGVFLDGRIRTFTRLAGGGDPTELPAAAWEIDDAVPRFSIASMNAERIHDPSAAATHWIFVDNAEWDAAMDGLREDRLHKLDDRQEGEHECVKAPVSPLIHSSDDSGGYAQVGIPHPSSEPWRNEILSIADVISVTGLKRSTIYAKVAAGSFPRQILIHGTRKGWRRGAVQDWLDALTRPSLKLIRWLAWFTAMLQLYLIRAGKVQSRCFTRCFGERVSVADRLSKMERAAP